MSDPLSVTIARRLGGLVHSVSVLVPSERLMDYLREARGGGLAPEYIECIFLGPRGTRPDMTLSRTRDDFESESEFVAFAEKAAESAMRAAQPGERAYFEIDTFAQA